MIRKKELQYLLMATEVRIAPGLIRASVIKLQEPFAEPKFVIEDAIGVIMDEIVVQLCMHKILEDVFDINFLKE